MKIIYKQPQTGSVFEEFGISNCCFKHLYLENSANDTTKRVHHHTEYELHIIENGHQSYEIGGNTYKLSGGKFLFIPPGVKHSVVAYGPHTSKVSLTFDCDTSCTDIVLGNINSKVKEGISFIKKEFSNKTKLSYCLRENRVFEVIMLILRQCGYKEEDIMTDISNEDARLSMAKQYIKDNIEFNLRVSDVASYCYLSTKQLTRLFQLADSITPAVYIQKKKIEHIEKLLTDTVLSLKDISDRMNFTSEYHFNSFFKNYAGMPPGEYRRMNK